MRRGNNRTWHHDIDPPCFPETEIAADKSKSCILLTHRPEDYDFLPPDSDKGGRFLLTEFDDPHGILLNFPSKSRFLGVPQKFPLAGQPGEGRGGFYMFTCVQDFLPRPGSEKGGGLLLTGGFLL